MKKADARFDRSRAAIVEAGIEVLLRNPDAGMSEIAISAGVGRATLYRHYESREALVEELAVRCLEETDEATAPLKAQQLKGKAAINATIDVLMPMAARFRFLMSLSVITADSRKVRKIYKRQLRELGQLVEQAQDAGDISQEHSTTWVVWCFDALLNSAWQLVQLGEMTPEESAAAFKRSFFSGCE